FLAGDRIKSSPYRLAMNVDMICEQLCITNLGQGEENEFVRAIRNDYRNNWIVDKTSRPRARSRRKQWRRRFSGRGFPWALLTRTRKRHMYTIMSIMKSSITKLRWNRTSSVWFVSR
ncbi:hypothetical protein THAOC_05374, partial [Thalassiosira oceanica]